MYIYEINLRKDAADNKIDDILILLIEKDNLKKITLIILVMN